MSARRIFWLAPPSPCCLDAECAWWVPPARDCLLACFDALEAAYADNIDWESRERLPVRAGLLLRGLFSARVCQTRQNGSVRFVTHAASVIAG
jgi:hypothetical protein